MPNSVRPAAVAGQFYPGVADALRQQLNALLAQEQSQPATPPTALIVPHAGYRYSGATAALAYQQLAGFAQQWQQILLLGPAHRVAFKGIASSTHHDWQTPLGNYPVDRQAVDYLQQQGLVRPFDLAHQEEHSLEVQIPFLQQLLPQGRLIPLLVGTAATAEISAVIEALWTPTAALLVVVSTDLSHFLNADSATERDSATATAITQRHPEALHQGDACGIRPLAALLTFARERQWRVEQLELCNSSRSSGDYQRVVGYGSFALYPGHP
ncbi:MAG: AmmeMemoRadiSam system protein B [Gammaproteobacteria bacterium]|nr:AmmeMemoRadiSam system protein B [Gammaproteobacteria bacterium]